MTNNTPAPKRRLGQHFLQSSYYAERIAQAVESHDECIVVEIGPGKGALSIFLKERFPRFHLIETDRELIPCLKEKLGKGEWTLHRGDVLDFDFNRIGSPLHIVGNLPYNIGALIIRKTLSYAPKVASVTFMVQREVAQRIVGEAHTKQNGFLSIFCQFFGTPKILFRVPPGAFFPKPRVESAVFQLYVNREIEKLLPNARWEAFFSFVSVGFSKRRKMLATSLAWKSDTKELIRGMIEEVGLNPKVRPEDLTVHNWLRLFRLKEGLAA